MKNLMTSQNLKTSLRLGQLIFLEFSTNKQKLSSARNRDSGYYYLLFFIRFFFHSYRKNIFLYFRNNGWVWQSYHCVFSRWSPLPGTLYTLYTIQLYTLHYTASCTLYTTQLYTLQYTAIHFTLHSCTLYTTQLAVHTSQFTLYITQRYTLRNTSIHFTLHS